MSLRSLHVLAAVAVALAPLLQALPDTAANGALITALSEQTRVPNLVSGVLLYTRLYDTVAEVVVFTLASMGVVWMLSGEHPQARIHGLDDPAVLVLCRLGATMAALVAVELALRGHLSPGGGFAAGVAGGTALALLLIVQSGHGPLPSEEATHRNLERTELIEKLAVLLFIVLAFLSLEGLNLPRGNFGALESGGWIPILNALMAVKVTLGSWTMVQMFIRYRGLL
ncbi:MnhB domain-containing protein [Cyanobium sp. ATX 6A2]|jgi:multicomponent Na+:H+ antiporter subunit B|uniref:MnhB domain-containing protein n=1 Tax=Cyanobium sp. ATX 6A2 TaxID=2823700 RepID=UPI0028F3F5E6|nr:MnhB domain-containing protein [Cyanobium sp. ATX 6A2]